MDQIDYKPLVAIHCLVYNHEPYLRDCFEGFLMQQTNFPFVAIVHDDASTDNSAAIICEYEEKYPDVFKPIYEKENQYSKRDGSIDRIMSEAINATGAKYVAMCEGDDYWTDCLKLQRQIDFLERNKEYTLSTENAVVVHTNGTQWKFSEKSTCDISMEELLIQRQFTTASTVFETEFYKLVCCFNGPIFDTFIWTFLSQEGKVHFNEVVSSVYRRGNGITESDNVRWAYQVESYNKNMYEKLSIPEYIIKIRNKNYIADCYDGIIAAVRKKKYKIAVQLFIKCLSYDWKHFILHFLFYKILDKCKIIYVIKKIIKKMLKLINYEIEKKDK